MEEAPSNLGIDGRYILTPDIFALLEKVQPDSRKEHLEELDWIC
jgi:UTP-glucose-1-phosphate uridylyltransferase